LTVVHFVILEPFDHSFRYCFLYNQMVSSMQISTSASLWECWPS